MIGETKGGAVWKDERKHQDREEGKGEHTGRKLNKQVRRGGERGWKESYQLLKAGEHVKDQGISPRNKAPRSIRLSEHLLGLGTGFLWGNMLGG